MFRRIAILTLPFLSVCALAQSFTDLDQSETRLRRELAASKKHRLASAPAPAKTPVKTAKLSCRTAGDRPYDRIDGELDLESMTLTTERAGISRLLDSSKGEKLVDERCGRTALPIASSDNYYVTSPHDWGEDILQLPKGSLPRSGAASFSANLHTCSYDGDWSASSDVAVTCTATVREEGSR